MTQIPPVPLSESTEQYYAQWAKRVKYALNNPAHAIRLPEAGLAIEVKQLDRSEWQPIMLPNGDTQFASAQDREVLFEMVTGAREIPEAKPQTVEAT